LAFGEKGRGKMGMLYKKSGMLEGDCPIFRHASSSAAVTRNGEGENFESFMRQLKSYLQHRLNPLHVYCRLREYGLPYRAAIRVSSVYERIYRVCGLGASSNW
jgi:hypothetical protein